MNEPLVTVLMPVHNGAAFLTEAIDSVLTQSFTDFEFIIVNDGSTDNSENIILSYSDSRIRYIKNEVNAGLIQTLNRGIDLARGQYIARMDADDICLPQRLQLQVKHLDENEVTGFVAATVKIIDETGKHTGVWNLDLQTVSTAAIRKTIVYKNCIAHPTVMGRSSAFKKFRYNPLQKHVEDYDLWLRALADGMVIDKISEPLLLYREHAASVTGTKLKKNFAAMHYCMKQRFLAAAFKKGNLSPFIARVFYAMLADGGTAFYKRLKRIFKA